MNKHDGLVDLVGHLSLSGLGDVIAHDVVLAVFSLDAVFVEVRDGITVVESDEGALRRDKLGVKGLDNLGSNGIGEKDVNDLADLKKRLETSVYYFWNQLTMSSRWSSKSLNLMNTSSASR